MLGGMSKNAQIATPDIGKIVNNHVSDINSHLGTSHDEFEAITFKLQVVNGTNYFVKCRAGSNFYHVRVFKPLPVTGNPSQFVSAEKGHSLGSDISYIK